MSTKPATWDELAQALSWWIEHAGDAFPSHARADAALLTAGRAPDPEILFCPMCHARHIDAGEFATKPHHTHSCQSCGVSWRHAKQTTVGVQFLPGFKDAAAPESGEER